MLFIQMSLKFKPGNIDDVNKVGTIIFNAFSTIAQKHGFPSDFPSLDIAKDTATSLLYNPNFYSVIAEEDNSKVIERPCAHYDDLLKKAWTIFISSKDLSILMM